MNVTEVLLSLDVVSQVGINDKLVTEGPHFNIRPNTYFRAAMRWWYDECRSKNYDALRSLFGNAVNLVELLVYKGDVVCASRVLAAVTPALAGVRNLSQTYRDDVDVYAKFTRLVKDVEDRARALGAQLAGGRSRPPTGNGTEQTSSSPSSPRTLRSGSPLG